MSLYLQQGAVVLQNGTVARGPITTPIEDFEDGFSAGWEDETGAWEVVSAPTISGNAVRTNTARNQISVRAPTASVPNGGLPNGSEGTFHIYTDESVSYTIYIAYGNSTNWVRVLDDHRDGSVRLQEAVAGNVVEVREPLSTGGHPSPGWTRFEVTRYDDSAHETGEYDFRLINHDTDTEYGAFEGVIMDSSLLDETGLGVTISGHGGTADTTILDAFRRGSAPISAGGTASVVASFEHGLGMFDGDLGQFDTPLAADLGFEAPHGDRILRANGQGEIYATPATGLQQGFPTGRRAECWIRWGDEGTYEHRLNIGWVDSSNNYLIRIRPGVPTLELGAELQGSYEVLDSTTLSSTPAQDTWYRIPLVRDDGDLGGADNELRVGFETEAGESWGSVSAVENTDALVTAEGVAFRSWNASSGDVLFWGGFRLL